MSDLKHVVPYIEALIFSANSPIKAAEIQSALEEYLEANLTVEDIEAGINQLIERYNDVNFALEIVEISGGFTFMTKGAFHPVIGQYLKQITSKKLSRSALETLSIIAYKQPVTKSEMESIRGVNCDYTVQKLLDKELVEITGRSEGIGKPLLYATSEKFMDYFGLKSMNDLPSLKEFTEPENSIGGGLNQEEE